MSSPSSPRDQDRNDDDTAAAEKGETPAVAQSPAEWQTRQPAQVTRADVEEAKRRPDKVPPPGNMGPGEGPSS